MNKSKIKGTAYELKIKKLLTGFYKVDFERVPSSGALHYLKGDVWCPSKVNVWPFCIECKHYKELQFNSLLTAKSNDIYSFWDQTVKGAKQMKTEPLLIFKWDRGKDFVAWNTSFNCKNQITLNCFKNEFKIALLNNWLNENNYVQEIMSN